MADQILSMLDGASRDHRRVRRRPADARLQTATRAERAGADDEMIVASLCHDIGKVVSVANHPGIAAEILKPYVRSEVVEVDPRTPGLPGPALLRALRGRSRRPREVPRRTLVRAGGAVRRRLGPDELRSGLPDRGPLSFRAARPFRVRYLRRCL